jgi:hypothetical protein
MATQRPPAMSPPRSCVSRRPSPPPHQGKYASLGLLHTARDWITAAVVLGAVALFFGGNSAYQSVSAARTNIQRKKALAALEKDA